MARPTLLQHRKFRRLAQTLGSRALALGSLELLWHSSYESGDDYLGDATDVEAAASWDGDAGALCRALVSAGGSGEAGFIEEVPGRPGHYRVHDLDDHAPDYVQKRRARELQRRANGVTLREVRQSAGSRGGKQTASKRKASGGQLPDGSEQIASNQVAAGDSPARTPAPAPAQPVPTERGGEEPAPPPKIQAVAPAAARVHGQAADRAQQDLVDRHVVAALEVIEAINAGRRRVVSDAPAIVADYTNLAEIAARLEAGRTLEECLHVVAICEAESKANTAKNFDYYNSISPFCAKQFSRLAARPLALAGKAPASASGSSEQRPSSPPVVRHGSTKLADDDPEFRERERHIRRLEEERRRASEEARRASAPVAQPGPGGRAA